MNILVVCTSAGRGGLELYAKREVSFLFRNENEGGCHFVVCEDGHLAEYVRESGVPFLYLQWRFRALPLISALKLARYIDAHGIDLVHIHWGNDLSLAAFARMLSRRKPRLVYTRHMSITRSKDNPYHRLLYGQVDKVLTVSRQVCEEAIRYFPLKADQIMPLYSGVPPMKEPEDAAAGESPPVKVKKRAFNIGMFGRIEHGKGQHVLIDALAQLTGKGFDISVTFVGHVMDENYFSQLKETITRKGLSDRVEFIGFVDDPMVMMPDFDVVTLLTYGETFGLVLVEAMRAGVTVIGTDAGGVPEIIQHKKTGLLVPPGNSEALSDALVFLYENSDQNERLAQRGKARADEFFDEEKNFNALVTVFREIMV